MCSDDKVSMIIISNANAQERIKKKMNIFKLNCSLLSVI